jgi:hypothetical protein
MRTHPKRTVGDELKQAGRDVARDLERAGDAMRRRCARELRAIGPMLMKMSNDLLRGSQNAALNFSRTASRIDENLRREGKRPSRPPPPPVPQVPRRTW